LSQADAPTEYLKDVTVVKEWAETSHAALGVNCSDCHQPRVDGKPTPWSSAVALETCASCHLGQTDSFLAGMHGMRLKGHQFNTRYAATDACLKCHADPHSEAYVDSSHAELWRKELLGGEANTGVSCATCHMPRLTDGRKVWVNHNQNAGLRPNETMARDVCASCHGLEFSLSALADRDQINSCFSEPPTTRIDSVEMAHEWFVQQRAKRDKRKKARENSKK